MIRVFAPADMQQYVVQTTCCFFNAECLFFGKGVALVEINVGFKLERKKRKKYIMKFAVCRYTHLCCSIEI